MNQRLLIVLLFIVSCFALLYCTGPDKVVVEAPLYKNWHDTVDYVGMNACRTCHQQIYETFIQTGMGESWDVASPAKSSANFSDHASVYDAYNDFYYRPFWRDSQLYIMEYRLAGKDTVFKRTELISYIVGSGQHTNSHIWQSNGYLYQAPLTYYTQKGIWELPPGFEDGLNTRWNRIISLECMNCHNMYPDFDPASENKFISVKKGIECERCHGPGETHINEKMMGILKDTSSIIDYSIVNPRHLSRDMQVELCQRCHLQGISVLNEGKTFFDFKPGQPLNSVMNVFMPRYTGGDEKFIMASHADRMKQSECFVQSKMTCVTCHNPHVSVKFTPPAQFNDACKSCHAAEDNTCRLPLSKRMLEEDNCYKCHMPVSETMDIPHVTIHDHRIQVPVTAEKKKGIQQFVGLECMTTANPSALLMAQGYLQAFEAFSPQHYLLDSAALFLQLSEDKSSRTYVDAKIRFAYLQEDFATIIALSKSMEVAQINDAWNAYRIGEGNYQTGNFLRAYQFYDRAVALKSADPEFRNKKGTALVALKRVKEAQQVFQSIVQDQPKYAPALSNLGYIYFLNGEFDYAGSLYAKAIALDPDYEQALMNQLALMMVLRNIEEAKKLAARVLKINPKNEKAKLVRKELGI